MSCKIFLIAAVIATLATVIMSNPQISLAVEPEQQSIIAGMTPEDLQYAQVVIPPHEARSFQNLFNLSAYLNTNRPNGTALTFVPLITLLSGLIPSG